MHICVVSPDYPTSKTIDFIFVDQLCRALSLKGEQITVIAPQSLTKCIIRNIPVARKKKKIYVSNDIYFTVIRPKYFSIGNTRGLVKNHNRNAYCKAVRRGFGCLEEKVDVLYGHFWSSVLAAYYIAKDNNIPLIASSGEETISLERIGYSNLLTSEVGNYLSGIIHVSTNNKEECEKIGLASYSKSCVIPNGIDDMLFYPRNRKLCRNRFGIKDSDFVIAYVGQFTARKGLLRLNEALKRINNNNIKAFYLGKGPDAPDYKNCLFCGTIMHDLLPDYLSAADIFVLPTEHEGCCNAIIEAMACGLPIISSNRPFNYDILDKTNSIMVDPNNVDDIAEAINVLMVDAKLREKLSMGAISKAKELTLDRRAGVIISFIKHKIGYDKEL